MAEDKSDKGFSVVDRRVSTDGDPGTDDSAAEDRAGDRQAAKEEKVAEEKTGAEIGTDGKGDPDPGQVSDEQDEQGARVAPMKVTFPTFILSLHTSALISLGILSDPGGGQSLSLEQAQQNIDLLEILQEKTRGNLSEEESKLLDNVLYELRMAYVQVSESGSDKES